MSALISKSILTTIAGSAQMGKLSILNKQNVNVEMGKLLLIISVKSAKMGQCQILTRLLASAKMEKLQILSKQNVPVPLVKHSLITSAKSVKMGQYQIQTRLLASALKARHLLKMNARLARYSHFSGQIRVIY